MESETLVRDNCANDVRTFAGMVKELPRHVKSEVVMKLSTFSARKRFVQCVAGYENGLSHPDFMASNFERGTKI